MEKRKDNKGRILKKGESQRKDGKYMFRWTDLSKKRKCIYSDSLNELREQEKKIQQEQLLGISRNNNTLNQQIEMYLASKVELRNSTIQNYSAYFDRTIKNSFLGNMRVTDIKKSHILTFYSDCSVRLQYSNGTIAILQKIIHPALELAVDDDVIRKNPSNGCLKNYPTEQEVKYALTFDEENELLERLSLCGRSAMYKPLICVLLYTGMRIGEAIGLTWDDIDMKNRTINVNHQLMYRTKDGKTQVYCENSAKTISGNRIIPMSEKAYEYIVKQKKFWMSCKKDIMYSVDGFSNFVFISHTTGRPIMANSVRRMLRRIVNMNKERSVQLPAISPHILRHTMCTRLAEAGVDLKTIQYIMGHTDVRTTMRVYNHVNQDRINIELKKINDLHQIYTKTS